MQKYKKGFTLVELMITMALLVILATVAIPSFQNSIYRNHSETASSDLAAFIRLARSEALLRASEVRICDTAALPANSKECPRIVDADDGNSWHSEVVLTAKKQGSADWEVLASTAAFEKIDVSVGAVGPALGETIVFDLQGRTVNRELKLCDEKNISCKIFTITPRGRTHFEKYVETTPGS